MISAALRALAILLTVTALAGCVASKNPIGPASEAASEPRLAGVWVKEGDGGGREYLHILERDKQLQVVAINHGDSSWAVLDGYVSAVGEHRFVNLRLAAADTEVMADVDKSGRRDSHPYSFVAIAFDDDDRLTVGYPGEALHQAVKDGRLTGEASGDYDAFITDGSDKIAALLGSLDDAQLFNDPKRYRRVALPP